MATFRYSGFSGDGQRAAGSVEAASEALAYDHLMGQGITPLALEASAEKGNGGAAESATESRRVPTATRIGFVRELATFIRADIPLLEALGVLCHQESNPAFRAVLEDLFTRVQGGESFSHALTRHERVFPPLLISMVRVGETSGKLAPVLEQMADWLEHEEEVRSEVRGALAYPAIVLGLGIVTITILVSFVLPRIGSVFMGMEANLPLPTRILMGISGFMGRRWWLVLAIAAALFFLARALVRSKRGKALYDRLSLRLPLVGPVALKSSVARLARACGALLGAGVPLLEALRAVRGLMTNSLMAAMVEGAIERVTRGGSLAKALGEFSYFPETVIHPAGRGRAHRTAR